MGTNNQIICIDERFAKEPVLCLHHLFKEPPMYLSSTHSLQDGTDVLIAGNQSLNDVFAYQLNCSDGIRPTKLVVTNLSVAPKAPPAATSTMDCQLMSKCPLHHQARGAESATEQLGQARAVGLSAL